MSSPACSHTSKGAGRDEVGDEQAICHSSSNRPTTTMGGTSRCSSPAPSRAAAMPRCRLAGKGTMRLVAGAVEALERLQAAHDWVDLGRRFIPAPERCFTWWSYRALDWTASDRGRRLDHMWASPALAPQAKAHRVLEPCRSWQRPSDHVPLLLELEV